MICLTTQPSGAHQQTASWNSSPCSPRAPSPLVEAGEPQYGPHRTAGDDAPEADSPPTSQPDNGSAFTARAFRARLAEHGITHRRGGYRDPESQAFIESWFGKLKQRCVWREEVETLDEARQKIGAYVHAYHHRPHQGLAYRTPAEVAATWKDAEDQSIPAA